MVIEYQACWEYLNRDVCKMETILLKELSYYLCAYVHECVHTCVGIYGGQNRISDPWSWSHRTLEATKRGCWEPNSAPLKLLQLLLTAGPALNNPQSLLGVFIFFDSSLKNKLEK